MKTEPTPRLSVVVIAWNMPEALSRTLTTLSAEYQDAIDEADYEIVVVENDSGNNMLTASVQALPGNFRYYLRTESGVSPVAAMAFALEQCRAPFACLILDGAQMLTPGVLAQALCILENENNALVAVPGYHLGQKQQHLVEDLPGLLNWQEQMFREEDWQQNGYRLFRHACFSPGNKRGFLQPFMEASALFCKTSHLIEQQCADPRFVASGGGAVNLHILRQLGLCVASHVYVLPGEGSFHQYHGGVTTRSDEAQSQRVLGFKTQLQEIWQNAFFALRRQPIFFGPVGRHAEPHLAESVRMAENRYHRLATLQREFWEDEPSGHDESRWQGFIRTAPKISIVCVVHNIPDQFRHTLHSLSPGYLTLGTELNYEVIVIENPSPSPLPLSLIDDFEGDIRHQLRETPDTSPANALNEAVNMARGDVIGILIDSAYMLTPGILQQVAWLYANDPDCLVSVPGYHLGSERQEVSSKAGYDQSRERELLQNSGWPQSPYELFNIGCFSGANPHGLLHPAMESHLLFCSRKAFLESGGADTAFRSPGGGSVNMDLYQRLVRREQSPLYLLWGEGVFHQYHGGVTTSYRNELPDQLQQFQQEFRQIRGNDYQAVRRQPQFFGPLPRQVMPFIAESCSRGRQRFNRFAGEDRDPWIDDGGYNR
ncbi:hypothetical protein PHACT_12005 [Pseudohongiella acticola]|uniref:Glycosyltransferase 2-like domain-containing protein n=1 Tax=Pseudohongiella acticola TaxID=1524254 RepID=A0A1E8CMV4_9GAMM|nr:glycosyltransferase family A protein [Pseudohongiella acticola]OFE13768.1 hypothetical protein PHACT_12005 [Pseudohongiella acticola]